MEVNIWLAGIVYVCYIIIIGVQLYRAGNNGFDPGGIC